MSEVSSWRIADGEEGARPARSWRQLPMVELHVHLDGAFDPLVLWEAVQAEEAGALPGEISMAWDASERLPIRERVQRCASAAEYHELVTCRGRQSLHQMLRCFETFLPSVRGRLALIERLAEAFCARQAASNVAYTEVRYSPHLLAEGGAMSGEGAAAIDPLPVLDAVTRGLRAGCARHAIVVNQILCAISFQPGWADSVVDLAHARRDDRPCAVVGIDIAAGEDALDAAVDARSHAAHAAAFARAARLGVPATVHAGEEGGASNVFAAVREFGARRIGHGYAAACDAAHVRELTAAGVHFEVCPTSSFCTSGWVAPPEGDGDAADWRAHPLRALIDAGASVSISTDDPAIFDTTLEAEYALCEVQIGVSAAQLVECVLCAARAAFTTDDERAALCERIAAAARAQGLGAVR
ncbi:hypothetical protein KFE25_011594 [Diacronema lutheri]|uniref:Adenosine deaminase n=1 Tax=Diacronema lutheri TaxID=2081491 RepID=A0A8J6C6R0_DIALT|nr:hypothetical protein KFE25_011594 [Diacronema lutheri]